MILCCFLRTFFSKWNIKVWIDFVHIKWKEKLYIKALFSLYHWLWNARNISINYLVLIRWPQFTNLLNVGLPKIRDIILTFVVMIIWFLICLHIVQKCSRTVSSVSLVRLPGFISLEKSLTYLSSSVLIFKRSLIITSIS
jgi:hypothetical protein